MALAGTGKLDATLAARAEAPRGSSRVILKTVHGRRADEIISALGGIPGRLLHVIGRQVALVPDASLSRLAAHPDIVGLTVDRSVQGTMERTGATVGAAWVHEALGYTGTGVGVAIIDSGVTNWHDDLGSDAVVHFADFVTNLPLPYDGYGHGTHVAGIIAGSGYDSGGARKGIAPGARLVVLKVLDDAGDGHISDVIAAIDYAVEHRQQFNIRVINLSVAAGVYESYTTDPLTLAAKRAVDAGIVVVTAAGNHGRTSKGQTQYGGITSPGNAPWVLTVGATDHQRTAGRSDDVVAPFSSRGPTLIDRAAKPDVVAPGVALESLADPGSTLYTRHPTARLRGTVDTAHAPYLALTGTSMAAPVVAATVALMLEANPSLTPNLVKAILQYTAERRSRAELAAQGAGFLNARGAVQLAASLAGEDDPAPDPTPWSRQILWGNQRLRGGVITADANAWREDVTWGAATTPEGEGLTWGRIADTDLPWGGRDGDEMLEWADLELDAASAMWPDDEMRDLVWGAVAPEGAPIATTPQPVLWMDDRRTTGQRHR